MGLGTLAFLFSALWGLTAEDAPPPMATISAGAFEPTTFPPQSTQPEATSPTETSQLTATTIQATTSTTPPFPLRLESSGLGVADLGAPFDETYESVTELLGQPDSDTGWINPVSEQFGTCPGTVLRVVRWASLRLFFSDGPTEFGEDMRHFFFYSQSAVDTETVLELTTPRQVAIGTTVTALNETYGPTLVIDSTASLGVTFVVRSGQRGLLSGTLSDSSPTGEVTSIAGGFGCGSS